jgi:hypothetical protein
MPDVSGELTEYRVTFGPAHNQVWAEGWVSVMAPDAMAARERTVQEYGRAWAFIYAPGQLKEHLFPLGRMATLTVGVPR